MLNNDAGWGSAMEGADGQVGGVATGPERALLRQLVVLAHAVPGAELRLHAESGEVLTVGRHPSADLTPCQLRRALLSSGTTEGPACFAALVDLRLGGSLSDVGGGFCHQTTRVGPQRWFATCLLPEDVARIAASIDHGLPRRAIECAVIADVEVGATAVRVRPSSGRFEGDLERVARALYAACLVEELYRQAFGTASPQATTVDDERSAEQR
jgi:hypothetical protein